MSFIADLHVHSKYSRATSKQSTLQGYYQWAQAKGVDVVGTGDFTHPGWFSHLVESLQPQGNGLFRLKDSLVPPSISGIKMENNVRFILSVEISSIYKKNDAVRKIHNLVFMPSLDAAKKFNKKLASIGNIESDGRPILGLDSKNLLEIVLETDSEAYLVPAHIWTPWFSIFGSKSGFDHITECFEELTPHIFALETGLSSDPEMNWHLSALDKYTLISNSDAHSPSKLAREANLFSCEMDYQSIFSAMKEPDKGFLGTLEFFPEEGKYHLDGHRKCGIVLTPEKTKEYNNICPVCGKKLTVGVMHRVMELADRQSAIQPDNKPGFTSLIPLPEILSEIFGVGPNTKTVYTEYTRLLSAFGSELDILMHIPLEDLAKKGSPLLSVAAERVRQEKVIRKPGFDGQFGVITVFSPDEDKEILGQKALFNISKKTVKSPSDKPQKSLKKKKSRKK